MKYEIPFSGFFFFPVKSLDEFEYARSIERNYLILHNFRPCIVSKQWSGGCLKLGGSSPMNSDIKLT